MLEVFKHTLRSFASDAYTSFTSTIERNGARPTTKSTSPIDVDGTETWSPSRKRKAEFMSEERPQHTRSVARFLNGFEAQEKEHQRKISDQSSEWDILTGGTPTASSLQRARGRRILRTSDRSDERRALGISEKLPADAISIPDPMQKNNFVMNGRLQPRNTLDSKASASNQFFQRRTSNKRPHPPITTTVHMAEPTGQKSDGLQENNHNKPNKKLKYNRSSTVQGSSQSDAINIEDSQDGMGSKHTPFSPEIILVSDIQTPGKRVRQQTSSQAMLEGIRFRPEPNLSSVHDRRLSGHMTSNHNTSHSADERSDEMIDDHNDHNFMKQARRQRVGDGSVQNGFGNIGNEKKKELDAMLPDSSPPRSPPVLAASRPGQARAPVKRTSGSRMDQRLRTGEESPDALQGDVTTITRPRVLSSTPQQLEQMSNRHKSTGTSRKKVGRGYSSPSPRTNVRNVFPVRDHTVFENRSLCLAFNGDPTRIAIIFQEPVLSTDPVYTVPVSSVTKIMVSEENKSPKLKVDTRNVASARRNLFYHFENHEDLSEVVKILRSVTGVKSEVKAEEWMNLAFLKGAEEYEARMRSEQKQVQESQRSPPTSRTPMTSSSTPGEHTGVKRARLVDKLDNPRKMTVISGRDRSGSYHDLMADETDQCDIEQDVSSTKVTPTVTPWADQRASRKSTRIRSSKADNLYDSKSNKLSDKESEFDKLKRWKTPLIYPPTGKKRETVQFDDLRRLDDDEYLNDNLVSLFIRYLEEHADKAQRKKTHFFNSFLIEALTKDAKTRRGINFDSVRRWTSKYDLFSRDFIIVPVNENLHWFVMIICNLSYFRTSHGSKSEDEDDDNDLTATAYTATENMSTNILQSDLEGPLEASTRGSFAEMTLDDQDKPASNSQIVKSDYGNRGRKKPRKSLPKYDVDKPIIITLDSLDQSRSGTASVLRQYIIEEAKDKKGWDIDGNDIKGMTAKGIPHQNNFSDCGLYLCMYLEQFILDPYMFVRRILQRTSGAGWPDEIESSKLRTRLRELLLNLHEQQYNRSSEAVLPRLGSILVDMGRPDKESLKTPETDLISDCKSDKIYNSTDEQTTKSHHTESSEATVEAAINSVEDWQRSVNGTIEIEDDAQPAHTLGVKNKSVIKSPYFSEPIFANQRTETNIQADTYRDPLTLANHIKHQREGDFSQRGSNRRAARSRSASTDYLMSGEGYELDESVSTTHPELSILTTSPLKAGRKRARDKFKRHDAQREAHGVDIEDDDFQGFSDSELVPQSKNTGEIRVNETYAGHGSTRQRKVLQELDQNDVDIIEVEDGSHEKTEMLV